MTIREIINNIFIILFEIILFSFIFIYPFYSTDFETLSIVNHLGLSLMILSIVSGIFFILPAAKPGSFSGFMLFPFIILYILGIILLKIF